MTKTVFGAAFFVVALLSMTACGQHDVEVISTSTAPSPTPAAGTSGSSTSSGTPVPHTVDVVGRVAAVSGTCPSLLFAIDSITITTSASTTFTGITCAQIVNGGSVAVNGVRQTDGSIGATSVSAWNTK